MTKKEFKRIMLKLSELKLVILVNSSCDNDLMDAFNFEDEGDDILSSYFSEFYQSVQRVRQRIEQIECSLGL